MANKIEILNSTYKSPSMLIINEKDIYPIKNFSLKGNYVKKEKTYFLNDGILFFLDLFDCPHFIMFNENQKEETSENISQNELWQKRLKNLDELALKKGKSPEKNPLKRLPPWFWNDVPEEDLPEWLKGETL